MRTIYNLNFLLFWLMFFSFGFFRVVNAQEKIRLFTGMGMYESVHAGISLFLGNHFLGISSALNVHQPDERNYSFYLEYTVPVFRNSLKSKTANWFIAGKAGYMYYEDDYYWFKMIPAMLTFGYYRTFGKHSGVSLETGPLFTIITGYHRKTFEEVGWPYHVAPNIQLRFFYKL